jgi:hypothetical protein
VPNKVGLWRARVMQDNGGREWPVALRTRHGVLFDDPVVRGRHRLITSIGEAHTRDGREIDTDLSDDGVFFRGRELDYGVRFDRGAGRVITPRPDHPLETLTVSRPQRFVLNKWRNVVPTGFDHREHQVIFQTIGGQVTLSVLQTRVATEVQLNSAAANVPWRWPLSLAGLAWQGSELEGFSLRSLSDGQTVVWLGPSTWRDSTPGMPKSGLVTVAYDGTNLTYQPAQVPADVVWPVVVDPDFGVAIAADADDGYCDGSAIYTGFGNTVLWVGRGAGGLLRAWMRFAGVTVPKGVTVSDAHFHWVAGYSRTDDIESDIYCLAEDDSAAPTTWAQWNTDHGLHTTGTVAYDLTADTTAGTAYASPNFAAAAQEVFARTNWPANGGNALQVHWDGTSAGTALQAAASYEHTTYAEPDLDITYTDPITNTYSWGMKISG